MHYSWYADASAVVFLDLNAREFHVKKYTTPISALDLATEPRAYTSLYILGFNLLTRNQVITFYRRSGLVWFSNLRCYSFVGNVRLIEVFRERERIPNFTIPNVRYLDFEHYEKTERDALAKNAWLASFFYDFTKNIFEKLAVKWEPETMRVYLKHLKAYCHYIESTLFFIDTRDEHPDIISTGNLHFYSSSCRSKIKPLIMREVIPKLVKFLFNNVVEDSSLVADIFYTVCEDRRLQADLFFKCDYEITEYILYHLKRAKCNINYIWKFFNKQWHALPRIIRSNPKHLITYLNCGFKKIYKLVVKNLFQPEIRWRHYKGLKNRTWDISISSYKHLRLREAAILALALSYSVPFVSNLRFMTCLESQRIIWRSLPDHNLTYQEMKDILSKYLNAQYAEDKCDEFQKEEFDSFDSVLQPRSLEHFCRCVVRDALICNSQMPDGIKLLGLPDRQQSYIRLEF